MKKQLNNKYKKQYLKHFLQGSDELKYWPKFQESQNEYNAMQLNGDGDFLMKSPFTESCAFWDSINPYANVFRKQN